MSGPRFNPLALPSTQDHAGLTLSATKRYKSKALAEQHTQTENFRALTEAAQKEELLAKPPVIVFTKTVGGYDWDRKLLVR